MDPRVRRKPPEGSLKNQTIKYLKLIQIYFVSLQYITFVITEFGYG